ncbi:MAG: polysaccharide pyruvyl transferase CsaB [Faecousia sp.]
MRILHIISGGDTGGAKTHVLSLLQGLKETQTVHMLCFVESEFTREARERGIPMTVYREAVTPGLIRRIVRRVREERYEVIHCHGAKGNVIGMLLRLFVDVPVISTVHSDPKLDYLGRPLAAATYGVANRMALRFLDSWIGVSDSMGDLLISRGFPAQRIYSIYNGVDFSNLADPMPRGDYLRSLGLDWPEDATVFGIAARISAVKDMTTLVKAFAEAVRVKPGIRLLIAGDGEQRQEIEALARRCCPAGSVHFAGWVSDTTSFYYALDVNLLTSLSETFPYAITEGARMRCATISTAVGGVPKVVLDEETGILIRPGDIRALADGMIRLANDPGLRKRFGDALYEKVRREFSVEATVERQVVIYETILRRAEREKTRSRDGVVVCGAYGKGNAGDDTILRVIVDDLRQADPDLPICVMTRRPRETAAMVGTAAVFTFSTLRTARIMKKSSLYISGGGSLIQDVTSTRSLLFYLSDIRRAKKAGCRVMMYGCGVGPLNREKNRARAARVINDNVDLITLRDPEAKRMLDSLGVTKPEIHVTADSALLQKTDEAALKKYCRMAKLEPEGKYCLFAVRPWPGTEGAAEAIAGAASYTARKYGLMPLFYAMEPPRDEALTNRVSQLVGEPNMVLPQVQEAGVLGGLMKKMGIVVAMRLHALIFAAGSGVPMAGISYDPKVSDFLEYLGQSHYVPVESLTCEALCRCIDEAIADRDAVEENVARLRVLAAQNGELARKLLS